MSIDPRHPVLIGAHELAVRTADAEPVAMMVEAARAALQDAGPGITDRVQSVRVVKGIWPYKDPGRLVAEHLGLSPEITTALTGIGGNATYDLVNETAAQVTSGELDVALICGAESMRTRRKDRAEGRRSPYLDERADASPDLVIAPDIEMADELDSAAKLDHPVNFYALVESAIRHDRGESVAVHRDRIAALWSEGSVVASQNPHAWIHDRKTAKDIATVSPSNRMVAAPYTKLMTSNINVDQGAALVLCAYETAVECDVPDSAMVFMVSGSGAADHLPIRSRERLDRSPAFAESARLALAAASTTIDDIDHLDLYSCFPASVQLARAELDLGTDRPFTMTGGLTFAGGPFNGYCTQALAHAVHAVRGRSESAFLYGNGGYFSKHSVMVVSGEAPSRPFVYERTQDIVDRLPSRRPASTASAGVLEAYTVTYDRDGNPTIALLSVVDGDGARIWAAVDDAHTVDRLLATDLVGRSVTLSPSESSLVPKASISD